MLRPKIVKVAKMLTDCMDAKLGLVKMDEKRIEYRALDAILTDEMADMMLTMGKRKHITADELAAKMKKDPTHTEAVLEEMAKIGIIEWRRDEAGIKHYVVPVLVVGSCEHLVENDKILSEHPEMYDFFYDMALEPLKGISAMVPPGGAGIAFHAIPVEKSIPAESQALSIEQLSWWLDKYEGHLAVTECVCRKTMVHRGEGVGEMVDKCCILLGGFADYSVENGRAEYVTREEIDAILLKAEENGCMHQITNGDGAEEIFAICNCSIGNCFALRSSQYFNNQNLSASCYRAVVDRDKCVACGKCVEVCPAGAAKLGQKLCTENGPVVHPHQPLPFDTPGWSEKNWDPDFRENNQKNCYPSGTAPCKAACPAHVSIQGVLQLVKEERFLDALKLLRMDNPFPSLCERACNRRCEASCMRRGVDTPMEIAETMKRLTEMEEQYRDELIPRIVDFKARDEGYDLPIAVKGAGWAQLSCAYFLAQTGYPVDLYGEDFPCSAAELSILEKLGVTVKSGEPEAEKYAFVYPDALPVTKRDAASLVEEGHEAAKTIHRRLHPGHSETMARNPRDFKAFKRTGIVLPADKLGGHQCLSCGVTYIDPNRCIGCGLCTTRCLFDAIHLERSHPEFADYRTADDTVKTVMMSGVKRAGNIAIKKLKRG